MSSTPKSDPSSTSPGGDELLAHVRRAAEALAEQLAEGERLTQGWSEKAQTSAIIDRAAGTLLQRLSQTGCWGEANRLPSSELWRIAGAWLDTGSLQRQARFKPRGYAGDFDMLAKICDDWCCEHPLGRAFDVFFQGQAAPRAVRHRTIIVADAIVEQCRRNPTGECHVVSVGSGPARDVERALTALSPDERERVRISLLDLDPLALDYAAARLARNSRVSSLLTGAQIIACVGFFDYLSDADASAMLAAFWRELAPGGRMLVFNFTPDNPSRAYMEWIGNWYLVYRSLADLEGLAERAGIPGESSQVAAEVLGVDAFLVAERPV